MMKLKKKIIKKWLKEEMTIKRMKIKFKKKKTNERKDNFGLNG